MKKEFDLDYWLEHKTTVNLVTRCGYPVEILTHNRKTATKEGTIVALVQNSKNNQLVETYYSNGRSMPYATEHRFDILMEIGETETPQPNQFIGDGWLG